MKVNEIVIRLQKEFPFIVRKCRLHFYDRIGLVKAKRRNDLMDSREYDESAYKDLRTTMMLSYLGIDLRDIDKLINKNNKATFDKIALTLKGKAKVLKQLKKELEV